MNGSLDVQSAWKQTEGLPEAERGKAFQTLLNRQMGSGDIEMLGGLLEKFGSKERMQQQLELASEFDERRMREAGKYKMLFDLPERLIQAATLPGQLAAEGSRGIAASMMQAGQQIPQLVGYTPRNSYSYTPSRYFQ
jgi:hypothetical protein